MADIEALFATSVYRASLAGTGARRLVADIAVAARSLAADDGAGRAWSAEKNYNGYTSYASLNDLPWRFPEFADLERHLDTHVAAFAAELDFDLAGRPLKLDSMWVNVLAPGGAHTAHNHPRSVISGTCYVEVPDGAGAIRFEDPRSGLMMAAPPRRSRTRRANQPFVAFAPKPGMVLLWESWLRHEVPVNHAAAERISVSFNYGLGA